ncbi:MAG: hypothetical protein PHR96_03105 [Clostridia bacterium]|nr:hypothetical protein [Clostridia bacterium]
MRIKIIDLELFEKTNAIYGFYQDKNINPTYEFEVYAIFNYSIKKKEKLLIDIRDRDDIFITWIINNKAIQIIDDNMPENWVFAKEYKGGYIIHTSGLSYFQPIKFKNLWAPQWMISDKEFFLNIYEAPNVAKKKFYDNEIKPHRLQAQKDYLYSNSNSTFRSN